MWLSELIPSGEVTGTGLALQHRGRYLFMLTGPRHASGGEGTFCAGIGGHREPGESWLECAQREALEELGARVTIRPAARTAYIARDAHPQPIAVDDEPRPLAIYELWNPPDAPWNKLARGYTYYVVIYEAALDDAVEPEPHDLDAILWLTPAQVAHLAQAPVTLQSLLEGGATVAARAHIPVHRHVRPQGTAHALALLWAKDDGIDR